MSEEKKSDAVFAWIGKIGIIVSTVTGLLFLAKDCQGPNAVLRAEVSYVEFLPPPKTLSLLEGLQETVASEPENVKLQEMVNDLATSMLYQNLGSAILVKLKNAGKTTLQDVQIRRPNSQGFRISRESVRDELQIKPGPIYLGNMAIGETITVWIYGATSTAGITPSITFSDGEAKIQIMESIPSSNFFYKMYVLSSTSSGLFLILAAMIAFSTVLLTVVTIWRIRRL